LNAAQVRVVGNSIVVLAIILFVTYTFIVYSNHAVYVPPPVIRPRIPIYLNYPDTIGLTTGKSGLEVAFVLYANNTIAENTTVAVSNQSAQIISTKYHSVDFVSIVFEETVPASFNLQSGERFVGGISMGPWFTNPNPYGNTSVLQPLPLQPETIQPFKWLVSGDYSPIIQVEFLNGTLVQYTYGEIKIHVASLVDIQNQKMDIENQILAVQNENLNKVNTVLTAALVVVAFVEAFRIVEDFARDRSRNHS